MITITEEKYGNSLKHSLLQPLSTPDSVALWWLGQAGFAVRYSSTLHPSLPYTPDKKIHVNHRVHREDTEKHRGKFFWAL
jgi:hypothetical protein